MHWESFFQACGGDPVIDQHAAIGRALDANLRVVLLTARPGRVRPQTDAWLTEHGERIRWDLLIMREDDDWGSSRSYKAGELRQLQRRGFDVQLSFEDDPRNVDMFRQAGVPTVYIHSGYYE